MAKRVSSVPTSRPHLFRVFGVFRGVPSGGIAASAKAALDSRPAVDTYAPPLDAGWSSLVARQAHNLKVVGSNPTPAPNLTPS